MKINTVQTILFRQLRELNERRNIDPPSQLNREESGTNPSPQNPDNSRRVIATVRHLFSAISQWLATYYNLCERTGLDLPAVKPQTFSRHRGKNIRLKRLGSSARSFRNDIASTSTTTPLYPRRYFKSGFFSLSVPPDDKKVRTSAYGRCML